jgi:hypothetical protein
MSIQDLDIAFELIAKNGGGDFDGRKDPVLVDKAEKRLGAKFPPSYKKFLNVLGCGDIKGLEFFGIINDDFENSSVPDAIWLTLDERKAGLPNNLILVYAAGEGTYCAIDTSQVNFNNENPVIAYLPDGGTKIVANDYGSFFLSELKTMLS